METLYERFGGMEAVARLVFAFYDRVLKSKQLAPYFVRVDMGQLMSHQTTFLSSVAGGPPSYTNAQLRRVHAGLGIGDDDFDEMLRLLEETLKAFELGDADRNAFMADLHSRRAYIVTSRSD
jgi:hemoglobin